MQRTFVVKVGGSTTNVQLGLSELSLDRMVKPAKAIINQ